MENDFTQAKEERGRLIEKLQAASSRIRRHVGLDITLSDLALVMDQAAIEIEDAEQYRIPADGKYLLAINAYREQLMEALKIANDPFKAPEFVVQTSTAVLAACWDMQTEYAAMVRANERRKSVMPDPDEDD